jgi:hypothetical protein
MENVFQTHVQMLNVQQVRNAEMDLVLILVREYLAMRHHTVKVVNAWITVKELHVYLVYATPILASAKKII